MLFRLVAADLRTVLKKNIITFIAITPKIQPFAKCHATISRYGTIIALILLRNKIEKPVTAMDKVPSVTASNSVYASTYDKGCE